MEGDENSETEAGAVLYEKGQREEESAWDDTALVEAYDRAVSLTYDMLHPNCSEASGGAKKKRVRTKKGKDGKNWTAGELCMAPYSEDGEYYQARIVSVENRKALVAFEGYEEEETVQLAALREVETFEQKADEEAEQQQQTEQIRHESNFNKPTPHKFHAPDMGKFTGIGLNPRSQIPTIPPPPLPSVLANGSLPSSQEALSAMLMSWYMTGYHTGYYQAMKERDEANSSYPHQ